MLLILFYERKIGVSSAVIGIVEKALPLMFETPDGTDWDALSECIVEQA